MKNAMSIPKRHTLRHYIALACKFYGEPEESAKEYIEDQLMANEHRLDAAIECFKGLMPVEQSVEHRILADYAKSADQRPWIADRKRKPGHV